MHMLVEVGRIPARRCLPAQTKVCSHMRAELNPNADVILVTSPNVTTHGL